MIAWPLTCDGADVPSDDRLRIHELRPSLPPREIHLHWRAGRTHSPLARRARHIAADAAAELAPPPASA